MCYSFIERHLINICIQTQTKDGTQFDNKEIKERGIYRAYKFLELALDYKINSTYWEELKLIGRLRNNLVHAGLGFPKIITGDDLEKYLEKYLESNISKPDKELLVYLIKKGIYDSTEINPNLNYCEYLIEFTKGLFYKIIRDLQTKYPSSFIVTRFYS